MMADFRISWEIYYLEFFSIAGETTISLIFLSGLGLIRHLLGMQEALGSVSTPWVLLL